MQTYVSSKSRKVVALLIAVLMVISSGMDFVAYGAVDSGRREMTVYTNEILSAIEKREAGNFTDEYRLEEESSRLSVYDETGNIVEESGESTVGIEETFSLDTELIDFIGNSLSFPRDSAYLKEDFFSALDGKCVVKISEYGDCVAVAALERDTDALTVVIVNNGENSERFVLKIAEWETGKTAAIGEFHAESHMAVAKECTLAEIEELRNQGNKVEILYLKAVTSEEAEEEAVEKIEEAVEEEAIEPVAEEQVEGEIDETLVEDQVVEETGDEDKVVSEESDAAANDGGTAVTDGEKGEGGNAGTDTDTDTDADTENSQMTAEPAPADDAKTPSGEGSAQSDAKTPSDAGTQSVTSSGESADRSAPAAGGSPQNTAPPTGPQSGTTSPSDAGTQSVTTPGNSQSNAAPAGESGSGSADVASRFINNVIAGIRDVISPAHVYAGAIEDIEDEETSQTYDVLAEVIISATAAADISAGSNGGLNITVDGSSVAVAYFEFDLETLIDAPQVTFVVRNSDGELVDYDVRTADASGYCDEPSATPAPADYGAVSFHGWFEQGAAEPFDFSTKITENITLTAKFSDKYLIQYKNGDGKVIYTNELAPGAIVNTPPQQVVNDVETLAGQSLEYWYIEGGNAESFKFGEEKAESDLAFVPKLNGQHYVTFVSAGSQVDNPVTPILSGEKVARPTPDPTRDGYDFMHWALAEDSGTPFDFNTKITEDTEDITLYAVWNAHKDVEYTVAVWMEKANIADADEEVKTPLNGGDKSNYSYLTSVKFTAIAGTKPDLSKDSGAVEQVKALFENSNNDLKYAEFQGADVEEIQGNGMTVVNLYAKRKVYTYTFDLWNSDRTGGPEGYFRYNNPDGTMTVNDVTYYNEDPKVNPEVTRYKMKAKYGQNISGMFPVWPVPAAADTADAADDEYFVRWYPAAKVYSQKNSEKNFHRWVTSGMASGHGGKTGGIVEQPQTLTADLISRDGQTADYTLTAIWDNAQKMNQYRYFVEALPGQEGKATNIMYTSKEGTKEFVLMTEHNAAASWGNLPPKKIEGLKFVPPPEFPYVTFKDYYYNIGDKTYQAKEPNGKYEIYRCFFYNYEPYTLSFNMMAPTGAKVENVPEAKAVKYMEPLTAFKPANDPVREGYSFAGWYGDEDYMQKFDFSAKMPKENKVVYAKWESGDNTVYYYDSYVSMTAGKEKHEGWLSKEGVADGKCAKPEESYYKPGDPVEGRGVFTGWFYEVNGKQIPFSYETKIWKDYELYPQWKTVGFKVVYDEGEGSGTVPEDANTYKLGTRTKALSGSGLKGPGVNDVFYAWKDTKSGALYYSDSVIAVNYGDITLEAQYAPKGELVTVTYVENYNNSAAAFNVRVKKGDSITLAHGIFANKSDGGREFELAGWNTEAGGDGQGYGLNYSLKEPVTENMTLYGVWDSVKCDISFVAGENGSFDGGESLVKHTVEKGEAWNDEWAPVPVPDTGYEFIGWAPAFPETVTARRTYVAMFGVKALGESMTIIAESDVMEYDGTALTNGGFTPLALPEGVTKVTAVVEGSQTDVGRSFNKITGYTLWNGDEDVTSLFAAAVLKDGTLEVIPNKTAMIITANSASRAYDGTALTDSGFTVSPENLPAGITGVLATVVGAQTSAGTSDNVLQSYTLWNGDKDVTGFFTNVSRANGTLTVTSGTNDDNTNDDDANDSNTNDDSANDDNTTTGDTNDDNTNNDNTTTGGRGGSNYRPPVNPPANGGNTAVGNNTAAGNGEPPTEIIDSGVPLAIMPDEDDVIITEEDVPLSDIPQTGLDGMEFNMMMLGVSLSALLAMLFGRKKVNKR